MRVARGEEVTGKKGRLWLREKVERDWLTRGYRDGVGEMEERTVCHPRGATPLVPLAGERVAERIKKGKKSKVVKDRKN